jgi:hypothetical protein
MHNLSKTANRTAGALLVLAVVLWAQTGTLSIIGGFIDFSTAPHTRIAKTGIVADLPATCATGEVYFATNATAGQNWYFCTATNTWTQQLNSGGGGGGTSAAYNQTFVAQTSVTLRTESSTGFLTPSKVFFGINPVSAAGAAHLVHFSVQ